MNSIGGKYTIKGNSVETNDEYELKKLEKFVNSNTYATYRPLNLPISKQFEFDHHGNINIYLIFWSILLIMAYISLIEYFIQDVDNSFIMKIFAILASYFILYRFIIKGLIGIFIDKIQYTDSTDSFSSIGRYFLP